MVLLDKDIAPNEQTHPLVLCPFLPHSYQSHTLFKWQVCLTGEKRLSWKPGWLVILRASWFKMGHRLSSFLHSSFHQPLGWRWSTSAFFPLWLDSSRNAAEAFLSLLSKSEQRATCEKSVLSLNSTFSYSLNPKIPCTSRKPHSFATLFQFSRSIPILPKSQSSQWCR